MPRPDPREGETSGGTAPPAGSGIAAGGRAHAAGGTPRAPAPEPRGLGAERAERLARLRAALPGAPLAPGAPGSGAGGPVPAGTPGISPDRTRPARLPAWARDPFSVPGSAAGFAEASESFAEIPSGFAEAPRGFAGAQDPPRLAFVPKPAPVPAFLDPRGGGDQGKAPGEIGREDPDRAAEGLARLPGVGPGLLWALGRARVGSLADLAALEPEALAGRLGPIGRLVPARAWIAAARAARRG